jgi:hydroxymethylpyrimidine/phosphomethylpyrimidine kinase
VIPTVLSIAGSDPSGGAGIQADLKVFSALGGYGAAVLTSLTAQNTHGVRAVHTPPPEFLTAQLEAIFEDLKIDSVKIGMLADAPGVLAVAAVMRRYRPAILVLDPVMVAQSGDRLLSADAVTALRTHLLPLADLVTPNLPEAAALLGKESARDDAGMRDQLLRLGELCPRVLIKGGHLDGPLCTDLLLEDGEVSTLSAERVRTRNTHGTGCALSSAVAVLRPQRSDWRAAVGDAKDYLTQALLSADLLKVGSGHGPPHYLHPWWPAAADRS